MYNIDMNKKKVINTIDLFAGCGGLSYGFEKAGFNIVLALDHDKDSIDTYNHNHINKVGLVKDIVDADFKELKNRQDTFIIGGPPCQGFSIAGKRAIDDPRNKLLKEYIRALKTINPIGFLIENVPNLASIGGGQVFKELIENLNSLGYKTNYKILDSSEYGVPQKRRRLVILGHKEKALDFPISQKKQVTVVDAISDLPESSVEDGSILDISPQSDYQRSVRNKDSVIYNHIVSNHTDQTKKIISLVPDGGNYKDLPLKFRGTRNVNIAWTRLKSDKPSFTIDTGHRHQFHYKYNRIPTVRESARIQSFPDRFIFKGSKTSQYRQVGNAVPPIMAYLVAQEIYKQL